MTKKEKPVYSPLSALKETDPEMYSLHEQELQRVRDGLQMIASENFTSEAVLEAVGSIFGNKYAEGYPGKRYYEGNINNDHGERLAIQRAMALFNAEHANVQLLSGGPANMAAYAAIINKGDTIMSMNLAQGGHLTHGAPVNFSGEKYNFHHYNLDPKTHLIDFDNIYKLADEIRPKLIVAGATAYPRTIDFEKFKAIAEEFHAKLMVDMSHIAGLVAGKVHPDPVPLSDIVSSTTHKTLRGPRGAIILSKQEYAEAVDKAVFPKIQAGPHMNAVMAKAVAFLEAGKPEFKLYAQQIITNARTLAEELLKLDYDLVSGGTDNHLLIMNLTKNDITGKEAAKKLDDAGICTNKNLIPYDTKSPFVTSGVRMGTPAMTTRGLKEEGMIRTAHWIDRVLKNLQDEKTILAVKNEIREYLTQFPLYPHLDIS